MNELDIIARLLYQDAAEKGFYPDELADIVYDADANDYTLYTQDNQIAAYRKGW